MYEPYQHLVDGGAKTVEDVLSSVGKLEHEQLEFKRQLRDLGPVIAAMAMTMGGIVILGLTDERSFHGAALDQKALDTIRRTSAAIGVEVEVTELLTDRGPLVVIGVPEIRGRIVTTTDGRLLRRIGSANEPLVGDALARFVAERVGKPGEEEAVATPSVLQFDLSAINRVLGADGHRPISEEATTRALTDLGVALPDVPPIGPRVLTAAAVLFAEDPTAVVPGARVQALRRDGIGPDPGPVRARADITGPLQNVVEEVLAFLREHTAAREVVTGTYRTSIPEYPEAAVREAVLNALAHRDYRLTGATTDLTIWDDRLELRSPGPLPGHITPENILDEHYSRNPRIMRVLKTLRLVEEYGEGVDRMFDAMTERLMEPPSFTTTSSSVTVTLWNRTPLSVEEQAWLGTVADITLDRAERQVLVLAREEGHATPRGLRERTMISDPGDVLRRMVARGLLVRIGERGGSRYELSDEVRVRAGSASILAEQRRRDLLHSELQRRGSLSTVEAATFLGADRETTRQALNELVARGLAEARGRTRARRYHVRED